MKWNDEGILIGTKFHGEKNCIIKVFTENHGLYSGLVQGGQTKKFRSSLQPGAQLVVAWSARLAEHLGTFQVDVESSRSNLFMGEKLRLYAFNSVCSMLISFLVDREDQNALYIQTRDLIEHLENGKGWLKKYVTWELLFLREIGFGLELSSCAVTGSTKHLSHVSPKTGRAVCYEVAGPWKDRLLKLPNFLLFSNDLTDISASDALEGLILSGHFFFNWVLPEYDRTKMPMARTSFINALTSPS